MAWPPATGAGTASVAELGLESHQEMVAAAVFVLLGSAAVIGALVAHLVGGAKAAAMLGRVKQFMLDYHVVIIMVIVLFFGVTILGNGISGLAPR